jgi:thiol:disulfide interchange protein DsbD
MNLSPNPLSFITVFFAGILVSFSPCVYPFIPITLAFIGVRGTRSRWQGFYLSLIYACGLSFTYALLATLAVLSGRVFGSFTQSAFFYLIIGNIYVVLALSLLDVFSIASLKINPFKRLLEKPYLARGGLGVFLVGVFSGLVIGPCTTPALGAILAYIAQEKNIIAGVALLITFALGMSFLLILSGTFGALLQRLPKSGLWNLRLKRLGAIFLLIGAEYFFMKAGWLL